MASATRSEVAIRELGKRSVSGTAGHIMMWCAAWFLAPSDYPFRLAFAPFVLLLGVRIWAWQTAATRPTSRRALPLIAVGAIGCNVVWGVLIASAQDAAGASLSAVVFAFLMCGIAIGGVSALAPSRWIQIAAQVALTTPVIVLGFAGDIAAEFAVLHVILLVYIVLMGKIASKGFWQTVAANEQLREFADAQHRAAIIAAETTAQLRDEIAQRLKVEVELRQAQKLEAIGRLAAGLAHEINTPFQFISDSCSFLVAGLQDVVAGTGELRRLIDDLIARRVAGDEALARLAEIDEAYDLSYLHANLGAAAARSLEGLERVAKIVRATKEFAHQDGDKAPANLNAAIESTLVMCRHETKEVADVVMDLGPIPLVPCYSGEVNQVLLNIIVNAAHAIGDVVAVSHDRGKITIKTSADDAWVKIAISDTGAGIPNHLLDKIWEPFFTTKAVGKGTGQGLAIARSIIVGKHGGKLDVDSHCGGTTFTIALPAA